MGNNPIIWRPSGSQVSSSWLRRHCETLPPGTPGRCTSTCVARLPQALRAQLLHSDVIYLIIMLSHYDAVDTLPLFPRVLYGLIIRKLCQVLGPLTTRTCFRKLTEGEEQERRSAAKEKSGDIFDADTVRQDAGFNSLVQSLSSVVRPQGALAASPLSMLSDDVAMKLRGQYHGMLSLDAAGPTLVQSKAVPTRVEESLDVVRPVVDYLRVLDTTVPPEYQQWVGHMRKGYASDKGRLMTNISDHYCVICGALYGPKDCGHDLARHVIINS